MNPDSHPDAFPDVTTKIFLNGPVGRLEVAIDIPKVTPIPITGIICHPHPLYSGTMENKVVTTTARAFKELGMATVRFNYRGVGQSEGEYAEAIGETEDVKAVIKWQQKVQPNHKICLAGFSFGSYVSARAASHVNVIQLITIAPPVNHFDFDDLVFPKCPWLIIQGDKDEVVPPQAVYAWAERSAAPVTLKKLHGASHFFHGRLVELRALIVTELASIHFLN